MTILDAEGPLRAALAAAIRAPSPHNTQPWRFEVHGDRIDVLLDRDRVLPVADPDGREARLSCGAAVFNIQLALNAVGRAAVVHLLPDPNRPDLLASVRIAGNRVVIPSERTLAELIPRRHTNRRPFLERPVSPPVKATLLRAAEREGARLRLVELPPEVDAVAALIRRADTLQSEDPAYRAELREWVHDNANRVDGVPTRALGPPTRTPGLITLRRFTDDVDPARERPFEQQPLLAVLTTPGDTPIDHVQAGKAMQRVLLTAADLGLCSSFLSQPIEVPAVRAALRALLRAGSPHVVLRLGYGYRGSPAPRRPVSEVTRFVSDDTPTSTGMTLHGGTQ
ncbi:Nitroreductase family protein [Actinokineospora alba]|uniref:Nitroreductase family protein n=1 Tax=Actinokineospora alba TaxID=504798 RepID=A0A1H0FPX6_9PSEU|nr:nitroreductase family protein [Actinokineospora alba]TDP69562.1 nitroreductase family protein [Actinokineospora alba]SDI14093.1 Nitroreductase family protein [Actinokineospora alba]SDN96582.1 Nitroreductase family protein [Actinokineospora alba]